MNKIFKVVWSKTKECYVVVSEVAKNNGGKKKVLASVLATLAIMGAGAQMGTSVQAGGNYGNSAVNIAPDNLAGKNYANSVSSNSVVVGFQNNSTGGPSNESGKIIYGANNTANRESSLAIGNQNSATNKSASAIGVGNTASAEASVALGNANTASGDRSIAIGSGAEATQAETIAVGREAKATAGQTVAIGRLAKANQEYATAMGYNAQATGSSSLALGRDSSSSGSSSVAVGYTNKAKKNVSVAMGVNNDVDGEQSTGVGSSNTIATDANQASAFGRENRINRAGAFAAGYKNTTNGERNVAVGSENSTTGEDSIGIGVKTIAGTGKTIAIGTVYNPDDGTAAKQTIARGNDTINPATGQVNNVFALAIGNGAQADGKDKSASGMIAIGQDVLADNNNTIAVGVKTQATGNNSTAVGGYSKAIGISSAAFGTQAIANGTGATAFGPGASAGTGGASGAADGSVAVGRKAAATAAGGVGIGWTASASEKNATAIGFSATASGVQSVAIGGGDEYDYPGTERGKHFTTASGKSSVAVGSYAKATEENAMAFGKNANANIADGVALGSESKTTVAAGVQGYNPASDRSRKYSDQANAVGTSTLAAVSIGNGLTATRQLTGLAAGTADTDAVNVAQLKNVSVRVGADTNTATIGTNKVAADFLAYNGQLNIKGDSNRVTTVSENDANGKDANVNVKFDYDGLVKAKAGSSVTVNQKTEGGKTVFEIDAPAATGGTTSTESVVKKAATTGDTNIADISVADGKATGDVGAKYEVSVSRNAVKDAAREAVTVNNGGTTKADGSYTADSNNPISVTPTKDDTNHNTSYAVTFDGNKAAKQIPLTYKANGNGAKTVTLEKGLDFTNGTNTTAEIDNDGVVKYNLNKNVDLSNTGSLTVGGTTVNNDGITNMITFIPIIV